MKIAFIGGGNMANALIGGLVNKLYTHDQILVIDPNTESLNQLQQKWHVQVAPQPEARLDQAQIVILATKPQQLPEAAQTIAHRVKNALIISIAAGVRCNDLSRWLDHHSRIIRSMPNTPALIGAGITGMVAMPQVSEMDKDTANQIMHAVGQTLWFDQENHLDAVTAISGSGPAYIFYFIEALIEGACMLGLTPDQSKQLALATFLGASKLASQSTDAPHILRERVTSKGGTTAAALSSLEQNQVKTAIIHALQVACQRATEIGNEFGQL